MHISVSKQILENEKLLNHLKEHSYYIKLLNRDPNNFKLFQKDMSVLYKERPTDKISEAIDGVEMLSTIIDSLK